MGLVGAKNNSHTARRSTSTLVRFKPTTLPDVGQALGEKRGMCEMAKGAKYVGLTNYLRGCGLDRLNLTFREISNLGAELPSSAYKWPALWSNGSGGSLSCSWLAVGYVSGSVNLPQEMVEFVYDPVRADAFLDGDGAQASYKPVAATTSSPDIDYYTRQAMEYYALMSGDENSRYRSWEHCYSFFAENRHNPDERTLDLMCLHLAWYLASWGMLRGGSFLLQKDYRVHLPVVRILTGEKAARLYHLPIGELYRGEAVDEIMALSNEIVDAYQQKTKRDELDGGKTASETLVTKILLGTLGCAPAYDRYFKQALRQSGIASGTFGRRSLLQLAEFYRANQEKLEACRKAISANGVEYTPMKVLDMCFWKIGFDSGEEDPG